MPALTLRQARQRRTAATTVTASGAQVTSGTPDGTKIDADSIRRLKKPWQDRAFDYYRLLPELWYASQFYARHMSKVELRVEYLDDESEWISRPDDDDQEAINALPPETLRQWDLAQGLLNRMRDATGGRGELIGSYGRLRFLVGESYLICLDPETPQERWECLSMKELQPNEQGKGYKRIKSEGFQPETLRDADTVPEYEDMGDSARVWRLWRRDPEYSMAADAPTRAVMDICEELVLLTIAVRAQARSRIAKSGLLLVPSEISPPPVDPSPNEDALEDPFLRSLTTHMEAPLLDEGAPASLVPLLVRGPAAYLQQLRQLQLHVSGADYPEAQLRQEAISRLANGLDMPREALLGLEDVNHWSAWAIDQSTWQGHVQPVVEDMCVEFTSAILRPALLDGGGPNQTALPISQALRWRIWYDAVKITNHPDRGKDAQDVYDRGALSKAALRDAKGFDDDDAPSEAERAEWVGIRVRDSSLAWYGVPEPRGTQTPEQATPKALPGPDEGGGETLPTGGGTGNDVSTGAPNTEAARLLGAAESAVWACRRQAGSRLVAKDQHGTLRAIPRTQIYARLGAEKVAELNGDRRYADRRWLVGDTEAFEHALEQWGYPPERIQALANLVKDHAAATLHQEEPDALPPILFAL